MDRVAHVTPPYDALGEVSVDVVVLRCKEPLEVVPGMLRALHTVASVVLYAVSARLVPAGAGWEEHRPVVATGRLTDNKWPCNAVAVSELQPVC